MSSGDGINSSLIFKYQGATNYGSEPKQNQYPMKWEMPHWPQGQYSPDMLVTEYHPDGSYEAYNPLQNSDHSYHCSGYQEHVLGDAKITNNPYQDHNVTAGHSREYTGGHHDPAFGGHKRKNTQGGETNVHKGDCFDFYKGNHATYHAGSSRTELAGGAHETRLTNDASHSTSIMHGSDQQAVTSFTKDASWRNMQGSNATINDKTKDGDITADSGGNTTQKTKKDWTHQAQGEITHTATKNFTAIGKSAILQKAGGMKIPAIRPPSVEATG